MADAALACIICGEQVDATGPGVCEYEDRETRQTRRRWIEFVEDWRGGLVQLMHPTCLARTYGVDALIDAVHQRDLLGRGVVWRLTMENQDLRMRLGLPI